MTSASAGGRRLPIPPLELRRLVGPIAESRYDNPSGELVYPDFPPERFESVFDFGCGCGRVARQLIQQRVRPRRYIGIDVNADLVRWCRENLAPAAHDFEFVHHDVTDTMFNPAPGKPEIRPFPVEDESVTFFEALSIFTHVVERQIPFYLREAARVLRADGEMNASFLLFDKLLFPALPPSLNALYVSDVYPPAGVYLDRGWLERSLAEAGLAVVRIAQRPEARGYQIRLVLARASASRTSVGIPPDDGPVGVPADVRGQADSSAGPPVSGRRGRDVS